MARTLKICAAVRHFPARSLQRRIFPTPASYPHLVWMKVENCGQERNTFHEELYRKVEILARLFQTEEDVRLKSAYAME